MEKLVAITYGKALFEVAVEENKVDQIYKELAFVRDSFLNEPKFFQLFKTPQITKIEKKKVVDEVFEEKLCQELMNYMYILLDKQRMSYFIEITKEYNKLYNEANNILEGTVYTAYQLKDRRKKELEKELSKRTSKSIKLDVVIDKSVIGGIKVKIGDKVIDATVQNQLKELKESLDKIIV